jgi:hypothetical protein
MRESVRREPSTCQYRTWFLTQTRARSTSSEDAELLALCLTDVTRRISALPSGGPNAGYGLENCVVVVWRGDPSTRRSLRPPHDVHLRISLRAAGKTWNEGQAASAVSGRVGQSR